MTPGRRARRSGLAGAALLAGAAALASSTLLGWPGGAASAGQPGAGHGGRPEGAALAVLAAGAPASPPAHPRKIHSGGIGVRLDTFPASQRKIPLDHVYIVRHMNIGTTATARITVSNTTRSVQHITLYPGAAVVRKGQFLFLTGRTPSELTTWTRLSTGKLTLKPDTQRPVKVAIHVPRDASQGNRYGVVWASVTSPHGQITEVNRVGIRMYIDVGPGGPPPPGFAIESLTAARNAAGKPMVVARVRDTGGVALTLTGTLRLKDGPGGTSAGPMPVSQDLTLTPHTTNSVDVLVGSHLPRGPWLAVVTLQADLIQRHADARLTFPAKSSGGGSPGWLLPAGIIAGALVLVGAGLLIGRNRRKLRGSP
jgi:hypothetical protein